MTQHFFVTGTDTGVGKTWATLALMRYFQVQGEQVVGMKPVASGCVRVDGILQNTDALLLQQHSSVLLSYHEVNPYAYELAASPHYAGLADPVDAHTLQATFAHLQTKAARVLVEGAGGWLSPISRQLDNADIAKLLDLPVIIVVAIRLGCINHARLTLQAITHKGCGCVGWIAMCVEPTLLAQQATLEFLTAQLPPPLLGVIPYQASLNVERLASYLRIN